MTLPGDVQIPADTQPEPQGSGEQIVETQANTPAPLFTQEQMNALIGLVQEHSRPIAQEVATSAFRGIQSAQQKLENRVNAKIADFEKIGVSLTPEQKEMVRAETAKEVANDQEPTGGQPVPNQPQTQPNDPVIIAAKELEEEYGVMMEKDDPEVSQIDQTSPRKFLKTYEAAIAQKKARLEKQQAINSPTNVPSAGQRGKPGNPIAGIKDMDTLYNMALQKKR